VYRDVKTNKANKPLGQHGSKTSATGILAIGHQHEYRTLGPETRFGLRSFRSSAAHPNSNYQQLKCD
ncbi:hypothetical protein BGZ52_004804, partial [Haplosporangium bisporale]